MEPPNGQVLVDSERQQLEKKLNGEGLDTEYWLPKLKEILGVTNSQALGHLCHEDYLKLEPSVRQPWEKQALKKILNIPDHKVTHKKLQEERSELMKKNQEQARLALKELKELQSAGKLQQDEQVKNELEDLRLAMNIPAEHWPPSGKPLRDIIDNLHKELIVTEGIVSKRENLEDKDVLTWASGGRVLEGIYKTNKLEDILEKRDHLISIPENFSLFGPEQGPIFQIKTFSSYASESTFTKIMENLGFSISCTAKGGYMGFSLETSNECSTTSESEQKQKSRSERAYICTTKYSYVPLASCYFPRHDIKLSSAALKELHKIEALLGHTTEEDKRQMMNNRCRNFFTRFGSHADTGPFHFGGIYWWKASSEGFKTEQLEEMKKQATDSLHSYVGASYSGFGVSAGVGVGVSTSHSGASFRGKSTEYLEKNIQLSVTKTGGPVEVDSLMQWKSGLLASNKTWCVIDRAFNLVPVWDIILDHHRKDFKDVHQVTSGLIEAYKAITKQNVHLLFGEELASAVDEAQEFLQDLESWEVTSAAEQLKKLIDFKQKLNDKTRNYSTWINVCLSNKALPDFLMKVIKKCENVPANETVYMKTQMRCLIGSDVYSTENVEMYSFIIGWIYHSEKEQKDMCICNFHQFIDVLQQAKNDIQEANFSLSSSSEAVLEAQGKSTRNISLSLYSLLNALEATEQADVKLLLVSLVVRLGYSLETRSFRYHLGWSEIEFMLNKMQDAHKEYLSLKDQSVYRAQAFLLLTSLTVAAESKDVSPQQKKERLCFMMDHMKESLSNEVSDVIQKYNSTDDLKTLEKDLHCLTLGNCEATRGGLHKANLVGELRDISLGVNQVNPSTSHPEDPCTTGAETHTNIQNQDLSDLIRRLGLENYYPKKMKREHVCVIDQFTLQVCGSQPSTESDLPFYFLQKLMMMDYHARDLICKAESSTSQPIVKTSDQICPSTESPNILENFFGVPGRTNEMTVIKQVPVHPMDVQMAIYHCADDFMRQWISTKLSICQFALPFLVPNPSTSEIEFPLWSLREVKKSWVQAKKVEVASRKTKYRDILISGAHIPMVSFFRFGNSSNSKSQLLNKLLSKHNHDIFFHRHCRGSSKNYVLMAGVAEIFWYCPSGKDDLFDQCIAFSNLHGDTIEHRKQAAFLEYISSVNVIFICSSDINSMGNHILEGLLTSSKPLICLCTDLENSPPVKVGNKVRIALKNRNEATLLGELIATINDLLADCTHACSLDECRCIAQQRGFLVDEDNRECTEGKALAQALMSLLGNTDLTDVKEQFLPLQGSLWHTWCRKDKELTRLKDKGNRSIEQHRSDIETEKKAIRQSQLERADPLNDLIRALITVLQSHSNTTKMYFLQWLKVFIDDLFSDQLVDLRQQYHELWSKIVTEKEGQGNDLNNAVQRNLEILSNKINASMFGLEHLLREVGQIYEALDSLQERDTCLLTLPQIAADLMVNGYPLELMDGDASYVPLKWVEAVLDELIKKLGDKKLFVLSVLGVQSTGKSTLLNTMFGLQFAVSAGRCTRGAFMQLVKVDEKIRQDLNFDFVLVVDTEGLRAIELGNKSTLNHDNELATFVIGLGNMTLINIYGENPSEIQDILQIAVQAFLRMKQVKLSPSCLFVHQNVGELAARDKNMEGRRRLQQKLDEMAQTAAQQELCEVTCFSDVIRFDANSHIHYFSHLWEGDPPMAPLNPNYSQNVQELRNQILMTAKNESQYKVLSISELKTRIRDLWRALLNENFVFSFKNTLEISAYSKLETKFSSWTWQLRSHMLDLQYRWNNRIKKGEVSHVDRAHLEEQVQEKYDGIMKDLKLYFSEDKDCEILVQWKANVKNRLWELKRALTEEIKRKSEELIQLKKGQSKLEQKKSEYEDNLFQKSKHLALKLKNDALGERKLRDVFNGLWNQWVTEVSSSAASTEPPNILADVESAIWGHFNQTPNILSKIKDVSKMKAFSLSDSEHIKKNRTWYGPEKTLSEHDKLCIKQVKDRLVKFTNAYVETKRQQKMAYNVNYIHEILNEISKEAASASKDSRFQLTAAYQIDLSLYLCHIAAHKFILMQKAFQESNDPVIYLESKREDFFNCFKISCQGATSITTFAECLCNKLKEAVQQAVYDRAALRIAGEMRSDYPAFNGNRSSLEKHILTLLAEEEDFEQYREYIHVPRDYFKTFIKRCVDEYCLDARKPRLKNILNITLDCFQNLILSAIGEATQVVKDRNGNASLWLDEFCNKLGDDINISRSDLKGIEHQEITDIEFLTEAMSKAWESTVDCLKQSFAVIKLETFQVQPHEILAKQLCGCWEQCPFCKAICTNTISGHDGDHSVHFHRPQVLTGIQWHETDHFVTDICSSLVASDCLMVLSESKQIPYRNYRQAGPAYENWSITPDNSRQSYWKWFVSHFRAKLEKDYCGKFEGKGEIPPEWAEVTKANVISELNQL